MCRESARGDMHRCRGQLTGDLVHVGDHQQETLRCSEGGCEGTGLQRAVQGTCGTAFTLQLFNDGQRAPDILLAFREPLIGPLGHGGRGGDGVDGDDLGEPIGNGGGGLVAIHNYCLNFTHSLCLTAHVRGVSAGRSRR